MSDRLEPGYFTDLYARDPDPWDFATSPYERAKYRRTLEACGPGPFGRALEVGCSIGVFTEMLAPRCEALLALDCVADAVRAARERCAGTPRVTVEERTLPEETPAGPFDMIVCAEVLYYWSRPVLEDGIARLRAALAPAGRIVAVHWRPRTVTYPLQGEEVHRALAERLADLTLVDSHATPSYLLDAWQAPG